jgi:hypothetical protein
MKSRQVWRHTCDFCKKSLLKRPAMEKHEAHCTANPNRKCRMCALIGEEPVAPAGELAKMMTPPPASWGSEEREAWQAVVLPQFAALRERTNGCPACMLAALRQTGVHSNDVDWDFSAAAKAWMDDFHKNNRPDYI